jgi:hypothetical protein
MDNKDDGKNTTEEKEKQDKPPTKPPSHKIEAIETAKSKIPLRKCMKSGLLPRFPFSMMMSGRSGSGKSNLMINLMTRKEFYGDYFHYIVVFSPTAGKYDDLYAKLNLPDENFIADFTPEYLDELIEARKKEIAKHGIEKVAKTSRICIIMDDVIANRQFLESPQALKTFALLRHYLCSVIVMMQSYTKLPRALRVNCNAVAVFPCLQSETEILIKEITPSGIRPREFEKVIEHCTEGPYDFLFINNHEKDANKRIRKNLDEIIDLNKYKKENFGGSNIAKSSLSIRKPKSNVEINPGPIQSQYWQRRPP